MTSISYVFAQLPALLPQLAVLAIGIVLALSHSKRSPRPSAFVLAGCGLMLATTVVTTLITSVLVGNGRPSALGIWFAIVGTGGNVLRAAGIALLIAAAFAERGSGTADGSAGSLSDRIGRVCASCGARGPAAASFCMHCGAAHA